MRRRTALAAIILAAVPALAADLPDAAGRFTLGPSRDGFVRLDTKTGAVSHCATNAGVWTCEPLPQPQDTALKAKVEALTAAVARLTATVAALDDRVGAIAPVASAGMPKPPVAAPPREYGPNLAQRAVARLIDMVRRLKHGDDSA